MVRDDYNVSVAILTTSYPLSKISYSGIFIKRFINKLPKDINIKVYVPDCDKEVLKNNELIYPIRYASKKKQILCHKPGGIPVALRNRNNYLLVPQFIVALFFAALKAAKNYDLIHANWSITGLVALIPAKIFGKPLIVTLRGEDMIRANDSKVYFYILKLIVFYADTICVVSKEFKNIIANNWPNLENKVTVVENGVEDRYLNRSPTLYTENLIKFVFIGSLIKRKNLIYALQNFKRIQCKNYVFNIVGDGEELRSLIQYVTQNGLTEQIKFMGAKSPEDAISILEESDVLVLPSISEGRPNVVLEAMALGKLIIASNIPGTNELVRDNINGMLFQLNDNDSFIRCIERVFSKSDRLIEYCHSAQNSIKDRKLLWSNTAEQYANIYRNLKSR